MEELAAMQTWEADLGFLRTMASGRERGFSSVEDYIGKRAVWQARLDRRGQSQEGERSAGAKYTVARGGKMFVQIGKVLLLPALLIGFLAIGPMLRKPNPHAVIPQTGPHIDPSAVGTQVVMTIGRVRDSFSLPTVFLLLSLAMFAVVGLRMFAQWRRRRAERRSELRSVSATERLARALEERGE